MNMRNFLNYKSLALTAILIVSVGIGALTSGRWLPALQRLVAGDSAAQPDAEGENGHDSHDDGHAGHDEGNSLHLDEKARRNIGLSTGRVEPQPFVKTAAVPAIVVERPGRSQVEITAPFTGRITAIHVIEGESVQPGDSLFDVRLTHEDLVTAQREYLRLLEELDVTNQEITRLEKLSDVVAGKRVLEKKYEQQKLLAALNAQRQGLLLHGMTSEQVKDIDTPPRTLLREVTIKAPAFAAEGDHNHDVSHIYHVQSIDVKRGQQVPAGHQLAMLGDHCLLYVEGRAFEDDATRLVEASQSGLMLEVAPVQTEAPSFEPIQLQVLFVADHVETESRALRFYLALPNSLIRNESGESDRFIAWRYRPGQRMEVKIPTSERWENQIVLPVDAVVQEGAEAFVFEQNGDHFDRIPVHVKHRGKDKIVIHNDGSLVGSTVALSGAYQMHLAIKNKAGGAIDPHAGHNH